MLWQIEVVSVVIVW